MNDILIPHLRDVFKLSYADSMLVQTAFFLSYFTGSLIYFFISGTSGDPINKIGYKNGIVLGLITAATGLFLFYPAAQFQSYGLFLTALFVLGLGFTLLQIAANPYVAILGDSSTASSRLNLAQAFNSLGTTLAPIIGGYLIYNLFHVTEGPSAEAVKIPYLLFGGITLLVAIIFVFIKLPEYKASGKVTAGMGALKFPQLSLGVIAIFMYVGGEVAIGSMLTNYAGQPEIAGLGKESAAIYVSLYWGSLMIGRFTGSAALGDSSRNKKLWSAFVIPAIVFPLMVLAYYVVAFKVSKKGGFTVYDVLPYAAYLPALAIGFIASKFRPARTLMVFSIINIVLLAAALLTTGKFALFNVIATGLFNSIMWPVIFTLAIYGLDEYTSQGSSLLVMGILGGAIMPWVQGWVADSIGVHYSYIVPAVCFIYLAFYGWRVRNLMDNKPSGVNLAH